jgi:hypothetical protein
MVESKWTSGAAGQRGRGAEKAARENRELCPDTSSGVPEYVILSEAKEP